MTGPVTYIEWLRAALGADDHAEYRRGRIVYDLRADHWRVPGRSKGI